MAIAVVRAFLGLYTIETLLILALTRSGTFSEDASQEQIETEFELAMLQAELTGQILIRFYGSGLGRDPQTGALLGTVTHIELIKNASVIATLLLPFATLLAVMQAAAQNGGMPDIATAEPGSRVAPDFGILENVTYESHPEFFDLILPPNSGFGMQFTGGNRGDVINTYVTDDFINAGTGDDSILMSPGNDTINGGTGTDVADARLLDAALSYDGATGQATSGSDVTQLSNIEILVGTAFNDTITGGGGLEVIYGEGGRDSITGSGAAEVLVGGAGNDTLRGMGGNDLLEGGAGANILDGGAGVDTADYAASAGRVLVDLQSDVSGAGYARFFEYGAAQGDRYTDLENIIGGDYADNLRGDGGDNILQGGGVSDRLYGRGGDDTLNGGLGADAIYGNLGADYMTGGPDGGRTDRYIYFQANESGVGAGNRDVITDFVAGEDRIELSRIDADISQGFKQAFEFIGDTAFSGTAGELRYQQVGGVTLVQADRDGDGVADFEIELTGGIDLTAGDFLI